MKDRASRNRVLVATINALIKVSRFASLARRVERHDTLRLATDTLETVRPADLLEVFNAAFLGSEFLHYLEDGRLRTRRFLLAVDRSYVCLSLHDVATLAG